MTSTHTACLASSLGAPLTPACCTPPLRYGLKGQLDATLRVEVTCRDPMHGQARVNTYFPPVPPATTGRQGTATEHGSSGSGSGSCHLGRAEDRTAAMAGTSDGAGRSGRGGGWAGQVVGTSACGEVTRSYLVPFEFKSGREYMGHRGQVRQCRSGA